MFGVEQIEGCLCYSNTIHHNCNPYASPFAGQFISLLSKFSCQFSGQRLAFRTVCKIQFDRLCFISELNESVTALHWDRIRICSST